MVFKVFSLHLEMCAANAIHMANDFIYGVGACAEPQITIPGLNVEAITANSGVITCLANDTGYENIFSAQLRAKAREKDILIVLSGSGNSKNIINALETANALGEDMGNSWLFWWQVLE